MRVLEVITGGEAGGAQRHLADLTRGMAALGDDVLIAHGGGTWIDERANVPTAYVGELVRAVHPAKDVRALRRLTAVADAFRPDVIHGHSSKAGFLARLLGRLRRRPVVFTAHGFVMLDPTRPPTSRLLYRQLEAWAARQSAAVIAVSERDRRLAIALGARRALLIPNAVALPERPWEPPQEPVPVIGFMARFSREKGFEVLVEALRIRRRPFRLKVAGDGPLRDRYRSLAGTARVRAEFVGWREDPLAFFRSLDVLVIPSWKEGLPYALLDALSLGLPVAVTDVGGMGDAVRALDPALVVPPGRPGELGAAVERALSLPRDFGERARRLVQERFSMREMVSRTRAVLWEASRA